MFIDYLKRKFLWSVIISLVITALSIVYYGIIREEHVRIIQYVLYFFGTFGALTVLFVSTALFFPKLVFGTNNMEEVMGDVSENYVEVYFYEGFCDGLSRVIKVFGDSNQKDGLQREFNFVNEEGDLVFKDWFLSAEPFKEGRTILMDKNFKFNIGSKDGNLLCEDGYVMMSGAWSDGKVKVGDGEGKVNFVKIEDGSLLWKEWKLEEVDYDPNNK